jgi:ABC-2 type transport system ATP-binding protein
MIARVRGFFHRAFGRGEEYPLAAKKIRFAYKNTEVLKNLNLTVKNSQIIAVVGRSGEGKSTFLNLIVGAITGRYGGKIEILGTKRNFAKEDIGFVPQDIAVVPDLTIEQNIVFFGNINGLKKEKALKAGRALISTLQLNVPLDRLPYELSGGQRVRLNILLSLLHDPKILILDEPFVGLDYHNRKLLWHFLQHQKNRRKTVILTTHLLIEAEKHSDRIVLLHKGRIYAKGNLEDIRQKLHANYIVEYKFAYLSKTNFNKIKKYCSSRDITVMDNFNNYVMFSVTGEGQRNYLARFFDKLKLEYNEVSFRQPNLDEISLKVSST